MRKILKYFLVISSMLLITFLLSGIISTKLAEVAIETENKENLLAARNCPDIKITNLLHIASDLWQPIAENQDDRVYCIQPGKLLVTKYNGTLYSKEQIYRWAASERTSKKCGCASNCPHRGYYSTTYYYCQNNHLTESSAYKGNSNLYDVGYILSLKMEQLKYPDKTTWSGAVQQAIWMSPLNKLSDPHRGAYRESGERIFKEATAYKAYYEKIMEKDSQTGKTGIKPKDLTDKNNLVLDTDQESKIHKLGPFKINYLNGYQPGELGISFGGISDMYLIGNNGERIDIKAFIRTKFSDNEVLENSDPNHKVHTNYGEPRFFDNYDPAYDIYNANLTDYWGFLEYFPDPGEEFYVEFEYTGENISSFKLHVDFKWMVCKTEVCLRDGVYYKLIQQERHSTHKHCGKDSCWTCHNCRKSLTVDELSSQGGAFVVDSNRYYDTDFLEIEFAELGITNTMKIGGFVYEDSTQTKENITNGILDANDIKLANVEVALYDATTNQLAKLATLQEENPKATIAQINDKADYTRRINPTLSDKNGYYEFRGVSTEKKYYLKFTYNGQEYIATDYLSKVEGQSGTKEYSYSSTYDMAINSKQYSGPTNEGVNIQAEKWEVTSKGTERLSERKEYDERFSSIGSSPNNYITTNSLNIANKLEKVNGKLYNETYTTYELAGFTLKSNGEYSYSASKQLVDTYLTVRNGKIIDTKNSANPKLTEGLITKTIKTYIEKNKKYPTDMKGEIYRSIAGNDTEIWKKLQFIEDCKINSYTKAQAIEGEKGFDTYPVYNKFTTYVKSGNKYSNNSYANGTYADNSTYANHLLKHNGNGTYGEFICNSQSGGKYSHTNLHNDTGAYVYPNVYKGQLFINQGLWKRQQYDVALRKDVYKATLEVNGKTEVYDYDKRSLDDELWEINVRVKDYINYYGDTYSRELYNSDFLFDSNAKAGITTKDMLNIYITYKIAIRNQSQGILAQIDEIVDYYDKSYTFMPDMSWAMYDNVSITKQEFYDIMVAKDKNVSGSKFRDVTLGSNYDWEEGQYEENTKFIDEFARENYQTLYINGLQNHKMQVGETAYIYLTFKVNGSGKNLQIESSSTEQGKQNIAEINGYSTFYADNTKLPNNIKKNSKNVAGLIDIDSNPGNFTTDDLKNKSNGRYEQNFEDDADRAKGINVYVDDSLVREINGTVWEDKRNTVAQTTNGNTTDAIIGDGIRQDDETKLEGIRVEIHEVIDGKTSEEIAKICVYNQAKNEWVWVEAAMETTKYEITGTGSKSSINTEEITKNAKLGYIFRNLFPGDYIIRFIYGGEYNATYNGQDFKSTTYQMGIAQDSTNNSYTEKAKYRTYPEYRNYNTQNQTATYGYNIYKADNLKNSSNVKINVSDAKDIWSNTATDAGNPNRIDVNSYSSNNYQGVTNSLAQTLSENTNANQKTQMRAETGVISAEFEYNRTNTDGFNNNSNDSNFYLEGNDINNQYTLNDVDFGLVERPKAGLELSKKVNNVKITLANNNILFDAKESMNNLLWNVAGEYNINSLKNSISSVEGKNNNIHNEYTASEIASYRDKVTSSVLNKNKGLIQVTMDEELMHGATIQITYDFKVSNVGEVDYNETTFYYTGKVADTNTIVKTSADNVIDYVENNLQFRKDSNKEEWKWNAITAQEINHNGYVNSEVAGILKNYNTIIVTTALNEKLIPLTESTKENVNKNLYEQTYDTTQLVLTQLITAENKNDDLTYDNASEIVKISNDVGRRMAFSVQGNLNPTIDFTKENSSMEIDSCIAERVVILPPFGNLHIYLYIGLGAAIAILLGTSIVLIKKKVLK